MFNRVQNQSRIINRGFDRLWSLPQRVKTGWINLNIELGIAPNQPNWKQV